MFRVKCSIQTLMYIERYGMDVNVFNYKTFKFYEIATQRMTISRIKYKYIFPPKNIRDDDADVR